MKNKIVLFGLFLIAATPHVIKAQNCYQSSVVSPTPFMGNDDEYFKLADGTIWQVKYEYEYMYEYYPSVTVCPRLGRLLVKDETLNIVPISGTLTQIISERGDGAVLHAADGSVWEVPSYDRYDTGWWLPPYEVIFTSDEMYMINLKEGKRVWVSRVR